MIETLLFFALGLLMLALGGDSIVKGASGLAQRMGLSPFTTGLLLVAGATSVPEIAVNATAAAHDQHHLALGNAVGSNIANIGLTLGAAALAAPVLIRWTALRPLWWMLVLGTVAVVVFGLDGSLSRTEGIVMLLAFAGVLAFALRRARDERPEVRAEIEGFARTSTELARNLLRVAVSLALLYFGARFIVRAAPALGEGLNLSPVLVGLLPVAIGTALPEVAAAVAAARRGEGDLVAGHVIGSSLVNLLLVVGGMAVLNDLPLSLPLPASFVRIELPAALAFALLLLPMLRGDMRVSRREGAVLLLAFGAWIAYELALLTR